MVYYTRSTARKIDDVHKETLFHDKKTQAKK